MDKFDSRVHPTLFFGKKDFLSTPRPDTKISTHRSIVSKTITLLVRTKRNYTTERHLLQLTVSLFFLSKTVISSYPTTMMCQYASKKFALV